ncbi:radical SAM protein [Fibrobacteres bacterium R8-0-B4]
MALTEKEQKSRNYLKDKKPYVYEKMQRFDDKIRRGESIGIIQMQYNYACNFKCEHCCIKTMQGAKKSRSLTPADVANLARQADELGLARFVITGGEPLIFKELDEIVAAINPQKFYINLDTNGWFLDEKKAEHLKELGVDRIQLSIDSLDAKEHDDFRRMPGSHERAMKAVDASLAAGLQIFIQTVVTKQRLYSEEFINFIKHFNNKGIGVFVSYAKPVGAWENVYESMITKEDIRYFEDNLEKKYNVFTHLTSGYGLRLGCIAVKGMFSITQTGDVLPCPYIQISIGNILKEPLKDIIDRGLSIAEFGELRDTCLIAEDMNFIKKYMEPHVYSKPVPVPWGEVFGENDKTVKPFNLSIT